MNDHKVIEERMEDGNERSSHHAVENASTGVGTLRTYNFEETGALINSIEKVMCPDHLDHNKRMLDNMLGITVQPFPSYLDTPSPPGMQGRMPSGPPLVHHVRFPAPPNSMWRPSPMGHPTQSVVYSPPALVAKTPQATKDATIVSVAPLTQDLEEAKRKAINAAPSGRSRKKSTTDSTTQKSVGGGDMKYKEEELKALMEICEEVLPMGKSQWEQIATRYNALFPSRPRQEKSLRGQLNYYAKQKPPTGDPHCPPLVYAAKQIIKKIKQRAEVDILDDPEALAAHELPAMIGGSELSVGNQTSSEESKKQAWNKKQYKKDKNRHNKLGASDILEFMIRTERMSIDREERRAAERAKEDWRTSSLRLMLWQPSHLPSLARKFQFLFQ